MAAVITFERGFERYRGSARRGAVGALIVAAHVGFIALFALGSLAPKSAPKLPPMLVDFLDPTSKPEQPPAPAPKLVSVAPVAIEVPQVAVPVEIEAPVASTTPPAEAPATAPSSNAITAKSESKPVPEMSAVAYLKPPAPHYPSESRRAREQGLVLLRVLIDEAGRASSVNVYKSSGHPRLDEAARDAVARALFKPYLDGGVARAAIAIVPVEFSLHT